MAKIIAKRKISNDFDLTDYLTSKGYQVHNHFALHSKNINGWEVWTLHVPKPAYKYQNYAIGMKGNKFVLIDPEGVVFSNDWLGDILK